MSIIIDIDIIIGRMLDALDFEEKIFLGERLGVDTDFSCVLDDMYPDRIAEMETEIGDELYKLIETAITEHPDVQRIIIQVETLGQENKKLKEAIEKVLPGISRAMGNYEEARYIEISVLYDALKGSEK